MGGIPLCKARAACYRCRGMRRSESVQTPYQRVEVWQSATTTEFRVAGAIHAWHHSSRLLSGLAWDIIAAGCLLTQPRPPQSILMLGLAGGTSCRILRHLLPDCRVTALEIDARLLDLARARMNLTALDLEIITGDAYTWLARNRRGFDVVFDDIYLAGERDVFRSRAWNPELLRHLRRAVAPGGLLGVNLITGKGHRAMQSHTRQMLRQTFPAVRSLRTPGTYNEVLMAGNTVATQRRLRSFRPAFGHWRDAAYWDIITTRTLR